MFNILVVEDDKALNKSFCSFLNQHGYNAVGCLNAEDAFVALYEKVFDIIISDIMMPDVDGFEFAKNVRTVNENIPILFVTARDDFASKEKGYKAGIDDYMVKPIDLDELLLKIGAILRRAGINNSKVLTIGNFTMNINEYTAYLNGEEISLTAREFSLLYKLLSYPKKAFTRSQLMNEFWEADTESGTRTVDVYMTKLRAKLADCDSFEIVTVRGLGYKAVLKNEKAF
ncbi:MAG: response regulator transcription factor [Ruminococcaceae bacterium]|nr:response regulator transcription factor [Oscillospiraceae bacterium]